MSRNHKHLQNQLFTKDQLIADSLALLRSCQDDGPIQLCFSGGKDSIVMYDLAVKAGIDFDGFMHLTGMDVPEAIGITKKYYPKIKLIRAANIWKLIKKKGLPSIRSRWCCSELKEHTLPGYKCLLIGIRAEESAKRKQYPEINIRQKTKYVHPILHWPAWAIWEYIEEHKLPYPEQIYSQFDRTGCIVCPFRNAKDHERYRQLFPATYRMFEKCARHWWDSKVENGAKPLATFEEKIAEWYRCKGMIHWWHSKEERSEDYLIY